MPKLWPKSDKSPAMDRSAPRSSLPVVANFENNCIVMGGGVAIFHLASARVVIVYYPSDNFWFLPKGRRDIHESTEQGAEREGYEESGYRNRLLPIPMKHLQPTPHIQTDPGNANYVTEPVWTQMVPQTPLSQYVLFWYIAETVPPEMEAELNERETKETTSVGAPYQYPDKFPRELKLKDRIAMEPQGYEPIRHTGMAADDDEATYESHLLPIEEAISRLNSKTQKDVVRKGWQAIQRRMNVEA